MRDAGGARAGVTLLELLVVLTIAGLLLSVSVAALGVLADRFTDPWDALGGAAADARRLAAQRSEPVLLRFADDGGYRITTPAGVPIEAGTLPLAGLRPSTVSLAFYPNGAAGGGSFCVRIAERWRSVELDRVSGRLRPDPCPGCCAMR